MTMMFGFLFLVLLLGVGLWWFVQQQGNVNLGLGQPQQADPAEIARMRFARGEITKEQYDEILQTLRA
jgi:uncharacterized membrane protein